MRWCDQGGRDTNHYNMCKPNFLVIGDVKAGTTSLHSYLSQHPQIYMPRERKELRYFAYDYENPYHVRAKSTVVRTLDEYLAHFAGAGDKKAIGEASPNYLRSPGAAARIRKQLPDARLIVSLRNPADRLHSLYQMHYRAGSISAPLDEYAFAHEATRIKGNFYWADLKRYFELFDRKQIMVILFDELKEDSQGVAEKLYEFLGLESDFVPHLEPQNTGGIPRNVQLYSLLIRAKNVAKSVGTPPPYLRRAWSQFRDEALQRQELDITIRRKILEVCTDDILMTQELIGRDLSRWLA
jgi:hypothetical protein